MLEDIKTIVALMRHASIPLICNPQGNIQVHPVTTPVDGNSLQQMIEYWWEVVKIFKTKGVEDIDFLRNWDFAFSSPLVRVVMGMKTYPEGLEIGYRHKDRTDHINRLEQKRAYYRRHGKAVTMDELVKELSLEIAVKPTGVIVDDRMHDFLYVDTKWTGAAKELFKQEMAGRKPTLLAEQELRSFLEYALTLQPLKKSNGPCMIILGTHETTGIAIREIMRNQSIQLADKTYDQLRNGRPISRGCGILAFIGKDPKSLPEIHEIKIPNDDFLDERKVYVFCPERMPS